jgi:hypothetical protein
MKFLLVGQGGRSASQRLGDPFEGFLQGQRLGHSRAGSVTTGIPSRRTSVPPFPRRPLSSKQTDLSLVRTVILGDRWEGDVSISGNSIRIVTNASHAKRRVGSVTIDARRPETIGSRPAGVDVKETFHFASSDVAKGRIARLTRPLPGISERFVALAEFCLFFSAQTLI